MGIGGDYNGADPFPYDAEDVSKYPIVFAKLIERLRTFTDIDGNREHSEEDIKVIVQGIAMKNILRVWYGVEEEAARLQKISKPAWEWVPIDEVADQTCVTSRESEL